MGELVMIAVVALVVLGPKRLPGVMREVSKTLRYVRNLTNELMSQYGDELKGLDDLNPNKILQELTQVLENDAASNPSTAPRTPATPKPTASKPAAPKPTAPKPAQPRPAATKPAATPPAAQPSPQNAPEPTPAAPVAVETAVAIEPALAVETIPVSESVA